ncbi:MAG TPA: R3H domain-containing nucleic acid-binding protein [Dehalococcoidia bacterium]|nr:R3H domain-containing nucleic acid-binding protein [Dehalococcoidia bacterium]
MASKYNFKEDLSALTNILPDRIQKFLKTTDELEFLVEVILDLGRLPEVRFPTEQLSVPGKEVDYEEINTLLEKVGNFGDDNRAGVERTLHRISVIRNRLGIPIGVTCRVGRAIFGTIASIEDIVLRGESVLLLGKPGVGKTTMLREVARVLSGTAKKRVVIVDTSNEIAGDGDVSHPAIGNSRRMQVPSTPEQHKVMVEAVENHMPEVIIIDEMSTELEALAARTIAERGVQLIATAHANNLENIVSNPTLSDLVGGTQTVTLGDIEARRRKTQKTILERKHDPTFPVVVEIRNRKTVGIHKNVSKSVDNILKGLTVIPEIKSLDGSNISAPKIKVPKIDEISDFNNYKLIFPFGVPKNTLTKLIKEEGQNLKITDEPEKAEILLTTKSHYGRRPTALREAEIKGIPIYVLRKGSKEQIKQFILSSHKIKTNQNNLNQSNLKEAVEETNAAILKVLNGSDKIVLSPQNSYIRKLQHQIVLREKSIITESIGEGKSRRVVLSKDPYQHV